MFKRTTAVNKILKLKKRKHVIQGGTWAGKTYNINARLVDYAAKNPRHKITITAETMPALKGGCITQFKDIMQTTGRWNENSWHGTDFTYFWANGATTEFKSFDSVGKAKAAGKRDVLFINEGNHISWEIADALMTRTERETFIDFNPDELFWGHEKVLKMPDSDFLLLKYYDNECCPQTIIDDLKYKQSLAIEEKKKGLPITSYWQNWCRVYIDGEIGSLQGVIYNNWDVVKEMPKDIPTTAYGLDFGFSQDETALLEVKLKDRELWEKELLYKKELTAVGIVQELNRLNVDKNIPIVADRARPEIIAEIKQAGYKIESSKNNPNSVNTSISVLQGYKTHITEDSVNYIREKRNYRWKVDKNGNPTNEPVDHDNHLIDCERIVCLNKFNKPKWNMY